MKRIFILKSILFIGLLMDSVAVLSQTQDSLLYENRIYDRHTHTLKVRDVTLPVALIATSALFVDNNYLKTQRENIQDALSAKGKKKFKADDYMQYSPMVAVYGLDLMGIKGKHSFKDRTIILAMSYAIQATMTHSMKFAFKEKRPDSSARNSFPSGHTATAFMGAQFLYEEYKDTSPWIGYAGYAIATATGYLRIYNDRHYVNDVVAGACIGIISTKLAYWLYPKCFKQSECNKNYMISGIPYCSEKEMGMSFSISF